MQNIGDTEYSAQHYGFSPEIFFKEFSETVLDEMALVVQHSLKELASPSFKVEDKEKLIENSLQIHSIWSQRAEVILHKLKPIINEFFAIPKNALLPVDEVHKKRYTEEEIKTLEEEVKHLEEKYAKELNAIRLYKQEIAILEKLEPIQKKVDEDINAINQFKSTLDEIKELEKLSYTHKEYKKLIENSDDESGESSDYFIHDGTCKRD